MRNGLILATLLAASLAFPAMSGPLVIYFMALCNGDFAEKEA
jgi:hypothetical protein